MTKSIIALFALVSMSAFAESKSYQLKDFSSFQIIKMKSLCSNAKGKKSSGYAGIIYGAIGDNAEIVSKPLGNIVLLPVGCDAADVKDATLLVNYMAGKQVTPDIGDEKLKKEIEKISNYFGVSFLWTSMSLNPNTITIKDEAFQLNMLSPELTGQGVRGLIKGDVVMKNKDDTAELRFGVSFGSL